MVGLIPMSTELQLVVGFVPTCLVKPEVLNCWSLSSHIVFLIIKMPPEMIPQASSLSIMSSQ